MVLKGVYLGSPKGSLTDHLGCHFWHPLLEGSGQNVSFTDVVKGQPLQIARVGISGPDHLRSISPIENDPF